MRSVQVCLPVVILTLLALSLGLVVSIGAEVEFSEPILIDDEISVPLESQVADLDGDGDQDVVVAHSWS